MREHLLKPFRLKAFDNLNRSVERIAGHLVRVDLKAVCILNKKLRGRVAVVEDCDLKTVDV